MASPSPADALRSPPRPPRDYAPLLDRLPHPSRVSSEEMMQAVADALWQSFASTGLSWIGFYTFSRSRPEEMLLGPRRDKPACSPIGLHGACGQCLRAARPLVVRDVAALGANYVACDPRDRSEVVVPLLNPDGSAWAVLDGDSHDVDAFDAFDALSLWRLLRHVGLSSHGEEEPAAVIIK